MSEYDEEPRTKRPFAYADGDGAGIGMHKSPRGDAFNATALWGRSQDEWTGETKRGAEVDAAALRVHVNPDGVLDHSVGGLTANAGFSITDSAPGEVDTTTAQIGAQANLVEADLAYRDEQTLIRGGVSAGLGAALRFHGGDDVDNDGFKRIGVGADVGPVSFDVAGDVMPYYERSPEQRMAGALRRNGALLDADEDLRHAIDNINNAGPPSSAGCVPALLPDGSAECVTMGESPASRRERAISSLLESAPPEQAASGEAIFGH